jgi:hypothetical protein
MSDATVQLTVVPAYYLDPATGSIVMATPANRVLAADFADKWNAWRKLAKDTYGWELLLSAPGDGSGYTHAMFRTPEDQATMDAQAPDEAASVDNSPHQAGHAVDLSLSDMQATYSNYNYNYLVELANQVGIDARLRNSSPAEPWHFDDNPRATYGTTLAAIQAIGNSSAQISDDLAAGIERPEEVAIRRYQLLKLVQVGAAVAGTLIVGLLIKQAMEGDKKKEAVRETAPSMGAVYAT